MGVLVQTVRVFPIAPLNRSLVQTVWVLPMAPLNRSFGADCMGASYGSVK